MKLKLLELKYNCQDHGMFTLRLVPSGRCVTPGRWDTLGSCITLG